MLIALTSVKHAPGVTTTALGLASAWPGPVLLAEADPAGADLPSWLGLPAVGGLVDALLELRRSNTDADVLWQHATALAGDGRLRLLSGVDDPAQAVAVEALWPLFADKLARLRDEDEQPVDAIADCGRLTERGSLWPLLEAADIVGIVLRPTVAGVRLTSRWLPLLRERLADESVFGRRLRLVVIGYGPYPPSEVADALDIPLLAALPDDPAAAGLLSAGGGGRGLVRSRLWRTLTHLADDLTRQQAALTTPEQPASAAADEPAPVAVSPSPAAVA